MLNKLTRTTPLKTVSQARFASKILDGVQLSKPLVRTEQAALVSHQWSMKPFSFNEEIQVPIYDFTTGEQTDSIIELD